jgi:hypothetical protein
VQSNPGHVAAIPAEKSSNRAPGSAPGGPSAAPVSPLTSGHADLLDASAISQAVSDERGYRTVTTRAELLRLGFSDRQARVPALLIPIWDVGGEIATYQLRPNTPRVVDGKAVKYETPRGSRMVLDVHPSVRGHVSDPQRPLFITEGIRKADAAVSAGLCCVALLGVWNWRGTNDAGGKVALSDFESIALNDRVVYIAFDSDVATKTGVQLALNRLRDFLASRGAHVRVIRLPMGPGGAKTGLDDYLAAGHSVDDLLALVSDEPGDIGSDVDRAPENARRSVAARIVELAGDAELFHTPTGEPFATVICADHRETHPVRSVAFKSWLRRMYWGHSREPVAGAALADVVETFAARAEFGDECHPVSVRVAQHEGRLYIDLADEAWNVVEIGPDGWRLAPSPPVRFRRSATMAPLPMPARDGSIELLRPFVNVVPGDAWTLFVGSLVAAFRASGPYLVLILHGVQGSAKSTTARVFRALIDPSRSALRAEPRDQQDLLIAARNNWVVAFDNVSHLQPWLSDALCRLSTGGGLGKRQLYTDQDEIVLDAQRPLVLTGITEMATRGDLVDRAIVVEQQLIDDTDRRAEDEFWGAFEAVRPQILGALYDAIAAALANEGAVTVGRLPRMADPARWVTAAEPALGWSPGTFLNAYAANRREGHTITLEASPIAGPVQELARLGDWVGPAGKLLVRLAEIAGEAATRERDWPNNGMALTAALKRLAPSLRAADIEWTRHPRTGNARPHSIRTIGGKTVTGVTSDTTTASAGDDPTPRILAHRHPDGSPVTPNRAGDDGNDGRDGHDRADLARVDVDAEAMRIFGGYIASFGSPDD